MKDRKGQALTVQAQQFGAGHTESKLAILQHYLDFYTTALKTQNFELIFAVSNPSPRAGQLATRVADHILERYPSVQIKD